MNIFTAAFLAFENRRKRLACRQVRSCIRGKCAGNSKEIDMAISSIGIGSGLQAEDIVTKLVALERAPLTGLKFKAASIDAKLSTFSQIKSLVSTLADATSKLTRDSAWNGMSVGSTNSAAITATVSGIAAATSFSMEVQQLARAQSTSSTAVAKDSVIGSGTLTLQLGNWSTTGSGASEQTDFVPGSAAAVNITILPGEESLTAIAAKINDAGAGVVATILRDASGERLMLRSKETGETSDFKLTATEDGGGTGPGLSSLAFDLTRGAGDPPVTAGMAANAFQLGQNTKATINGVSVSSTNTTFADTIPGLSIVASQVTTAPVEISVKSDKDGMKKSIQTFVDAYNAVNELLSSSVAYNADTKTAGILQGDATTISLQTQLRNLVTSTGAFGRLSDLGLDMQTGGKLTVNSSKLDAALQDPDRVKNIFANATGGASDQGVAVKFKSFTDSLLAFDGTMNNKSDALTGQSKRNLGEQDKVNARAAVIEKRLRAQYSALDAQMGSLNALSAYVSQQVTMWNRNTS
ncbi:MAG: flagellar filament capping protein FliD [Giesbergeria sp.]